MTCIVAIKDGSTIHMGADRCLSESEQDIAYAMSEPKIFRNGPALIGYCGSLRAGKIFQHDLVVPKPDYRNLDKYMNTDFVRALMESAERNKLITDSQNADNDVADLLVGIGGKLFAVQSHIQATEINTNYFAEGSGMKFALGSLHATEDFDIPPRERLKMALKAAEKFAMSVSGPFDFLSI